MASQKDLENRSYKKMIKDIIINCSIKLSDNQFEIMRLQGDLFSYCIFLKSVINVNQYGVNSFLEVATKHLHSGTNLHKGNKTINKVAHSIVNTLKFMNLRSSRYLDFKLMQSTSQKLFIINPI